MLDKILYILNTLKRSIWPPLDSDPPRYSDLNYPNGYLDLKSSNLDWPELEKRGLSQSFIITLKQSYDVFPTPVSLNCLDLVMMNLVIVASFPRVVN